MATVSRCPALQEYLQLLQGHTPLHEGESLLRHLEDCSPCAEMVEKLVDKDFLVQGLGAQREAAAKPGGHLVAVLIEQLSSLQPPGAANAPEETAASAKESVVYAEGPTRDVYEFLAPAEQADEVGRLGCYRVLSLVGVGGMGMVFQAEDLQLKRLVTLKVMKPELAVHDSARQRFLREARAIAALEHDNVIAIHQVGEERGVPFFAMPLLRGETLQDRLLRERVLPLAEVLRLGRQVAEGLAAAHERGLIHRDIKPANLFLVGGETRSGSEAQDPARHAPRVRILDFGLARLHGDDLRLTASGAVLGTPQYMAPEQARGETVDERCDLFSLGCVLYRMATGEVPFQGANAVAILRALRSSPPKSPTERNPGLPSGFSDLVLKLLAKDAAERPASARAVIAALETLPLGQTTSDFLPAGALVPSEVRPPDDASGAQRPADISSVPPPAKGRRRLAVPLAAAVLLAVFGFLGSLFGPTVIRIATNQGELIVEADDPPSRSL